MKTEAELRKFEDKVRRQLEALRRESNPDSLVGEQVVAALARLETGTFGLCTSCGEEIDDGRLANLPWVAACLDCKRAEERAARTTRPTESSLIERARAHQQHVAEEAAKPADNNQRTGDKKFEDIPIPNVHRGGTMPLQDLPVSAIKPADNNPRTEVGDVADLAQSIAAVGLMNPLTVVPNGSGDTYNLIAGHRRLAAVVGLGWDHVPAIVFNATLSEKEIDEMRIIENLSREDLSPLEEARAFKSLVTNHGMTQRSIAERIGCSQSHVSKRLALMELPPSALDAIGAGQVTLEEGAELVKLVDHPDHLENVWVAWEDFVTEQKEYDETPEADRPKWGVPYRPDIKRAVAQQLEEIRRNEARAEAEKKLKDKGIKIVKRDFSSNKFSAIGKGYGSLDLPVKKHEAEPCHAVYFEQHSSKPVPCCTDTTRHAQKGPSSLKRPKPESKQTSMSRGLSPERRAELDALNAAEKERTAFTTRLISKGVEMDVAVTLFLQSAPMGGGWNGEGWFPELDLIAIADRLEVKPNSSDKTKSAALRTYVDKSGANRARTILAMAVCNFEWDMDNDFEDDHDIARYRTYFDFLERHGYQISEVEKAKLEEKTAA